MEDVKELLLVVFTALACPLVLPLVINDKDGVKIIRVKREEVKDKAR